MTEVGMCWEKAFDSSNQTIIHHAEADISYLVCKMIIVYIYIYISVYTSCL